MLSILWAGILRKQKCPERFLSSLGYVGVYCYIHVRGSFTEINSDADVHWNVISYEWALKLLHIDAIKKKNILGIYIQCCPGTSNWQGQFIYIFFGIVLLTSPMKLLRTNIMFLMGQCPSVLVLDPISYSKWHIKKLCSSLFFTYTSCTHVNPFWENLGEWSF